MVFHSALQKLFGRHAAADRRRTSARRSRRTLLTLETLERRLVPAPVITLFPTGIPSNNVTGITTGPDGNLWFTEGITTPEAIGRMTTAGIVTGVFTAGITGFDLSGITTGPDGNLWFTEAVTASPAQQELGQIGTGAIGRITPTGTVTEFTAGLSVSSAPFYITKGPDGNLWFTESNGNRIGRITPAGVYTPFSSNIPSNSLPTDITLGPDGNLWFTQQNTPAIGRITPTGTITEFITGTSNATSEPRDITLGPDGNLWFTDENANAIGRITPTGTIKMFTAGITGTPNNSSGPQGIAVGPDGNLWFTEEFVNQIARITPAGVVTEFAVPGSSGEPMEMTLGPDHNLWFTDTANEIGRVSNLTGSTVPTVTINKGYTVALGGTALPIEPSQLQATETGFSAAQLTYTVKALPLYGPLDKSGVALAVGGTFTQADLNNGLITYQNTDSTHAAPTGVTTSFAFTVTDPNGKSSAQQTFLINFGRVKAVSPVTDGTGHLFDYIQFQNGTVYRTPPFSLPLVQVVSTPTVAISAGTDNGGNADVTIDYASNDSLWTYTSTGATQLVFAQESSMGNRPLSFVAGLHGVVDVVFSDHDLWQINLASPASPTFLAGNVNFAAIGVHGTGAGAVEADYIAYLDSGSSNGGVWEHYVSPSTGAQWVPVTSLDVYAISASQDLSDTADLIVSSRNAAGVIDHQVYGWRGTAGSLTEITGVAVFSVAIDAAGNDYYVLQSTGGLYEHKQGVSLSTPATPVVTPDPTPVASVGVANAQTDAADILFANATYWQVTGLISGTFVVTQVAT